MTGRRHLGLEQLEAAGQMQVEAQVLERALAQARVAGQLGPVVQLAREANRARLLPVEVAEIQTVALAPGAVMLVTIRAAMPTPLHQGIGQEPVARLAHAARHVPLPAETEVACRGQ